MDLNKPIKCKNVYIWIASVASLQMYLKLIDKIFASINSIFRVCEKSFKFI